MVVLGVYSDPSYHCTSHSAPSPPLSGSSSRIWIISGYLLLCIPPLIYSILHLNIFPFFLWAFLPHQASFCFFLLAQSPNLCLTGLVSPNTPLYACFILASVFARSFNLFFSLVSHILLVMCLICCSLQSLSPPHPAISLLPCIPSSITHLLFTSAVKQTRRWLFVALKIMIL